MSKLQLGHNDCVVLTHCLSADSYKTLEDLPAVAVDIKDLAKPSTKSTPKLWLLQGIWLLVLR